MLKRRDIIDISFQMGCKKDLTQKGMVQNEKGDVFCVASFGYLDGIYVPNGILSPKIVKYCGVYSILAKNRFDETNHETRKNIAVTKTDGVNRFVYFYEKRNEYTNEYYFHGRYKFLSHKMIKSDKYDHKDEVEFTLEYVDRPQIIDYYKSKIRLY